MEDDIWPVRAPKAGGVSNLAGRCSPYFTGQRILAQTLVPGYYNSQNVAARLVVRVRLGIGSMADPTVQDASHGDVDHGFGAVAALFVVAHRMGGAITPVQEMERR